MEKYELSYWEWNQFFKNLDVVIVGSGIVGLSTAISLKERAPKLSVLVVDRGPLPIGASTRNAGFACFGSLSELLSDLEHHSRDEVMELVKMRYQGLRSFRERYGDSAIGYQAVGGYELFRTKDETVFQSCYAAMEAFNEDLKSIISATPDWPGTPNAGVFELADTQLSNFNFQGVKHLILNRAEGQLDTGKLVYTLLQSAQQLGVLCMNGLKVTAVEEGPAGVRLLTEHGWEFSAKKVVVATNGFAKQFFPAINVQPARNQVLITQPIPDLRLKGTFHYDQGYVYFRTVGQRLLLGGGRNLAPSEEETTNFGSHEDIRNYLLQLLAQEILPGKNIVVDRWWSGILGVGAQKKPIIREYYSNVIVAVRLGGMGVAIGTLVGEQAADKVLESIG